MDLALKLSRLEQAERNERCPSPIRRKSGALVHSVLHTSTHRPSSMLQISTCVKAVHFGTDIEQTRSFFRLDSPDSISTETSVIDEKDSNYDHKSLYDEGYDADRPSFKWMLLTPHLFPDTDVCRKLPVMLRSLSLTDDQNYIYGSVVVANLAAEKAVVCRFTCDEWHTVSEVSASYCTGASPVKNIPGYDCFTFLIDISDIANLESTSLSCCIRYNVNGNEFWDNNESFNFQVHFSKTVSNTDTEGMLYYGSHSAKSSADWGAKDSRAAPGHLAALSLSVRPPEVRVLNLGSLDYSPNKAKPPVRPKSTLSLPQLIPRARKAAFREGLQIDSPELDQGSQSSGNIRAIKPLTSKTYRGVQSVDVTVPSSSYEYLLERHCFVSCHKSSSPLSD